MMPRRAADRPVGRVGGPGRRARRGNVPAVSRRPLRRLLAPALVAALALGLGACGDDDDDTAANSDGGAPPSSTIAGLPGQAEDGAWVDIIRSGFESLGVVDSRVEGDTRVLIMGDGSTTEDVTRVCDAVKNFEGSVSVELDGEVTDCT